METEPKKTIAVTHETHQQLLEVLVIARKRRPTVRILDVVAELIAREHRRVCGKAGA